MTAVAFRADRPEADDALGFIPLIDILLILLVVFLGASVGLHEIVPPPGPGDKTAAAGGGPAAVIEVTAENVVRLNGEPLALDDLGRKLKAEPPEAAAIRADAKAEFGTVRRVYWHCREAGVTKLTESARTPSAGQSSAKGERP